MPAKAGTHDTSKSDGVVKADRAVDPCLRRGDGVLGVRDDGRREGDMVSGRNAVPPRDVMPAKAGTHDTWMQATASSSLHPPAERDSA
jgi:hypothetical protein